MVEELARHRCIDRDGIAIVVVEHCNIFTTSDGAALGQYRGAGRMTLLDGEPVRAVDAGTFEVVSTGQLLTHDRGRCGCQPAVRITTAAAAVSA